MSTNPYEIDTRITRSDYVYLNFPYDRDIISYIKEHIPDRKYVSRTEEWKFKLTVNNLPMFLSLCQTYSVNLSSRVEKRIRELIEKGKKREKIHKENQRIANQESTDLIDVKGLARGYNLYDFQEVGVEYIVKNRRVILGDEPGLGKASTLDSKLLTPQGWVKMKDISLGDNVIGSDGTPTTVTGVFPQGEKDIYEVEFSDGAKTQVCDEHLWLVRTEDEDAFQTIKTTKELIGNDKWFIPIVSNPVQFSEDSLFDSVDTRKSCVAKYIDHTFESKKEAKRIQEMIWSLGGTCKLLSKENDWSLSVNLPTQSDNNQPTRSIENITYVDKKEAQCIRVDADDSLYVTDDYIVTHNTAQIIASIHHEDAYPALIVCPNSLKGNWKNEWDMWLPRKTVKIQDSSKDLDLRSRVTVINYAILHKYKDELIDRGFKSVALDESHYIKNADARRSKVANDIVKSIDNSKDTLKILATGTAALNRPVELVHQLKTIDRFEDEFGTFMSFAKRFCNAQSTRWGLDTSGASNTQELHKRLVGSGAYIRRNKEDVIEDLPEKQRQSIYVDIDNRREYNFAEKDFPRYYAEKAKDDNELMNRLKSYANNDNELEKMLRDEMIDRQMKADANEFLMKLGALRQLATDGKMKHIRSWIDNFLESGEPLVVFAHHRLVTDMIADRYDCPKITGEVTSAARTKAVDSFTDGEHQIIVLNIEAGGVGLNLHKWKGQNVTNMLFAQLSWSWGELTQAENRIHRIGSDSNKVNIYYLLAENTVDEYMMDVLKNKQIVTTSVNEGRDITDDSGNIVEDTIKRIDNKWA